MGKDRIDINCLKTFHWYGVPQYHITRHQSVAPWKVNHREFRKKKEYRDRVDLIQDLEFDTAPTRIKPTADGEYLIASGIYPPQVKVYALRELAMKFERHLVSEIINFQILEEDYSKIAFLCADRSVCLHAKYGSHHILRIPRQGRDIAYDCWSCDLLCAASSPDLYRINLQQGCFLPPFSTSMPGLNVVSRSSIHGLVACGGENGYVECFDPRNKSSIAKLNVTAAARNEELQEITALQFDDGGYLMAVGSDTGKVLIYDLRSSHPTRVYQRQADPKVKWTNSKVRDIKWHRTTNLEGPLIISTQNFAVNIWHPETGENFTYIDAPRVVGSKDEIHLINDVCIFPNSGLILLAKEVGQITPIFIPALGSAPNWCSYLDNMTEELEEKPVTRVYDDQKFLTKEQLEQSNLTSLLGTHHLHVQGHGFFIDSQLYAERIAEQAISSANPSTYEEYIERRKQEKLEKERASHITIKRKLPRVNRQLAVRLLEHEDDEDEMKEEVNAIKKRSKKKCLKSDLLSDDRFAFLFENKDFEIDELSPEYLSLHPQSSKNRPSLIEEHFEPILENFEDSDGFSHDSASSSDNIRGIIKETESRRKQGYTRLYEVKDERHAEAFRQGQSLAAEDALSIEERVCLQQPPSGNDGQLKLGPGGSRELSFISRCSMKSKGGENASRDGIQRGVQSLALKPIRGYKGRRR